MKKILLSLSLCCALFMVSCQEEKYKLPWDDFCYSVENAYTVEFDSNQRKYIIDLLNAGTWTTQQPNCISNYIFYTQQQEVRYHSECGVFYDVTSGESMKLSNEQRLTFNAIIMAAQS